jgi:hypothetical protein
MLNREAAIASLIAKRAEFLVCVEAVAMTARADLACSATAW